MLTDPLPDPMSDPMSAPMSAPLPDPLPDTDAPHAPLLAAWLAQAQHSHADTPDVVMAGLLLRAASLPADTDGAQAIRLAEHVWLAHRGDAAGLQDFLQQIPAALHQAAATAPTVARARWAITQLRAAADAAAPETSTHPAPDVATRWRALQNLVLALAWQGRCQAAASLLAADEAQAAALGVSDAGRAFAASANNVAQHLCDGLRGSATPAAELDGLMLQSATLARRAWASAGTWLHIERAEYRLALCHAAVGDGTAARHHALLCMDHCKRGDGHTSADAVEHYFAHEALARAHHSARDLPAAAAAVARMSALLPAVDEADGLRDWCAEVLQTLPADLRA